MDFFKSAIPGILEYPSQVFGYQPARWMILVLTLFFLSGCNLPNKNPQGEFDVTQAYQTIEARLTDAVAQTPETTQVENPEKFTMTPTTEGTASAPTEAAPSQTPVPEQRCDQAAAAYPKIDITIEDDTQMVTGQSFTKVWRVANIGTCAWTPGYAVVWFSGERMNASTSQPLNVNIAPGQSIDISVDMTAPSVAGIYQGNWKLRNASGVLFGIGPSGESPFWVRIRVVSVATQTPTPTFTVTPTPNIQASGAVTLVLSDTLDLDNLLINTGNVDLEFKDTSTTPIQYQLSPLGSVTVNIFGNSKPALADCQSASLSTMPITLDGLPLGSYLCYRTNLGLPGWARLDGFDASAGTVGIQILTWKLP